jgi:transposase
MAMVIGVDSHKETLAACAVDDVGRQEGAAEFQNSAVGHAALLNWALQLPGDHEFAIEGSGGFGRSLAIHLAHHRRRWSRFPPG